MRERNRWRVVVFAVVLLSFPAVVFSQSNVPPEAVPRTSPEPAQAEARQDEKGSETVALPAGAPAPSNKTQEKEPAGTAADRDRAELERLSGLSLNELLNLDVALETMNWDAVWSASKRAQRRSEAASEVIVLTSDEIRATGAVSLGEVLRLVAGVDVRQTDASQHVIGIRGFADTRHVLVTIDGNSAFMYHANHIFLEWMPVILDEIDRVEIVKGPGSVLYGGAAFSGVINIYTKSAAKRMGGYATLVGGSPGALRAGAGYSGRVGRFEYSVSLEHQQGDQGPVLIPQDGKAFSITRGSLSGRYNVSDDSSLSLVLRDSEASNVISRVCQPSTTMLSLRYEQPNFWIRGFVDRHVKTFWSDTFKVGDWNQELEALYSHTWEKDSVSNTLSVGSYLRYTRWYVGFVDESSGVPDEKHGVMEGAVSLEDELRLTRWLILNLGGRVGSYYYKKAQPVYAGRASAVVPFNEDHSLRATVALGYYLPSLFEQTNEGSVYPYALGNPTLEPEQIVSYQLSYSAHVQKLLTLNAAVFYNTYLKLIDDTQAGPQQNFGSASQVGGELEARVGSKESYAFANYSLQRIERDDTGTLPVDPRHKVNLGGVARLGRWSLYGAVRWVDAYYELYLTANPVFGRLGAGPERVPGYQTVDARVAYRPIENYEVALSVSNLLNNRHFESNATEWRPSDEVGRLVLASIQSQF